MVGPLGRGPFGIGIIRRFPRGFFPAGALRTCSYPSPVSGFQGSGKSFPPVAALPLGPRREDVYYSPPPGWSRGIGEVFREGRRTTGRFRCMSWGFSVSAFCWALHNPSTIDGFRRPRALAGPSRHEKAPHACSHAGPEERCCFLVTRASRTCACPPGARSP